MERTNKPPKQRIKRIIDALMVILMPMLMAYSLVGETLHEVLGITMFILFIVHHYMNRGWIKAVHKGRYNATRTVMLILNMALLVIMFALPISGIVMSKHLFTFLNISEGSDLARLIHISLSNWALVLMSVHVGFHLGQMIGRALKSSKGRIISYPVMAVVAAYGAYAFNKRMIWSYMTLKNRFVFFDFSEAAWQFMIDYLFIMGLFAVAGYLLIRILSRDRKVNNND